MGDGREPLEGEYLPPDTDSAADTDGDNSEASNVVVQTGFKLNAICFPLKCDNCGEDIVTARIPNFCQECGIDFRDPAGAVRLDDSEYPD